MADPTETPPLPPEWLWSALERAGEGILVTDDHGRVLSLNRPAETLTGWTQAEARGRNVGEIFHTFGEATSQPLPCGIDPALASGPAVGSSEIVQLVHREGRAIAITSQAVPIPGAGSRPSGAVLLFRAASEARSAAQREEPRTAILDNSEALATPELDGVITDGDRGAETLRGDAPSGAVGTPTARAAPDGPPFAAPFQDSSGRTVGHSGSGRDALRQHLLAEAGKILGSSLDYETTLAGVCRLVVPGLADWCSLDLVAPDGSIQRVEVAHRDPEKIRMAHELRRRYPPSPDDTGGLMKVVTTGLPEHYPEITDEMLVRGARDAQHLEFLRTLGLKSVIIVPLNARGRTLGGLTLVAAESAVRFGDEDLQLARELAARAALAVDNARLFREAEEAAAAREEALQLHRGMEEQLALLVEASGSLSQSLELSDVQGAILDLSRRLVAADAYAIWRFHPPSRRWGITLCSGLSDAYRESTIQMLDRTPSMPDSPVIAEDVLSQELLGERRDAYEREGIRSLLAAPLSVRGRRSGTIVFYYQTPHRFTPVEVVAATALANLAGSAIGTSELYEELRTSEERLRLAQRSAKIGTWDWNLKTGEILWSEGFFPLRGLLPGEVPPGGPEWLHAVHPDDRAEALRLSDQAIRSQGEFSAEFRVRQPDGSYRWIASKGRVHSDASGQPVRFLGVNSDIHERREAEEQLREADRRKDEFLAMLAHELRNPLSAIAHGIEILERPSVDEADRAWARDVVFRQVNHLARLIDDLLDVSRVSRGKIELKTQWIEATPVLRHALDTVQPLMNERKHRVDASFGPGGLEVEADPTRLEQIFVNLLTNAAKYTDPGGHIALVARRQGDHLEFTVRDNGIGISPDRLPEMFELFAQGDRSLARSEGGLGIGLTLVKALTEMHGGTLAARSDGPGLGSEFTIRLPAAAPGAAHVRDADPLARNRTTRHRRILIVDDNIDAARGLSRLLRITGHEVEAVHTGPEGIEMARSSRPEVILLDIGLPGMDGYEVARRLRREPGFTATTIIAISGYGQDEDRRRSREAGFDHHLVKPIEPPALMALLADEARLAGPSYHG